MMNGVLLLGNGLNNVTASYKWKNLISDLSNHLDVSFPENFKDIPFPLLYEEIYFKGLKEKRIEESQLRSFISQKITNIAPGSGYENIKALQFQNIITTNYDYNIERSLGFEDNKLKNNGFIKESRYSVFRCMTDGRINVWHIHGENHLPNTIILGYEHYSGQLQHLRNYAITGSSNQYRKEVQPLNNRLKEGNDTIQSWLDLFLTKNVYIVGLSLDFVEIDIWWAITYRARLKLEKRLPIENSIYYYFPGKYEDSSKSKLEVLSANEIHTTKIGENHDKNYYAQVFEDIKKHDG